MKFRVFGILVLLFSLNLFAQDDHDIMRFSNGAKLVINEIDGIPRELLYFGPDKQIHKKFGGGENTWIALTPKKMTPKKIIEEQFQGVAPRFWPVSIIDKQQTRMYINEDGEGITVAVQPYTGTINENMSATPDKWELHKVIFENEEYLVIVEERVGHNTLFLYLRLGDGQVAIHESGVNGINRAYFDETTGLLNEGKGDAWVTLAPRDLHFKSIASGQPTENYWFSNLEEAKNLKIDPVGPFFKRDLDNPGTEKSETYEQSPETKKEISVSEKGEEDIAALRADAAKFQLNAAEFAHQMGGRTDLKSVAKLRGNRYTLVKMEEKVLGVFDIANGEVIQTIPLEDKSFFINIPHEANANTFTIVYPELKSEDLYTQPTIYDLKVKKVKSNKANDLEICRWELNKVSASLKAH